MRAVSSSAVDWAAVETALQAWVQAACTGVTGFQAVFAQQSAVRPPEPFATIKHDGGGARGLAETSLVYNGAAPAGQEVELNTREHTEFTVSVQVFTKDVLGAASASALANRIRNAAVKQLQGDAFATVNLAVVDRGTVQNMTDLLDTRFEGRAALDVRFRVSDGAQDKTGYIATVGPIGSTVTE